MSASGLFAARKISFSLRLSKLKINIRINKHGLYEEKSASPGVRSNILSWQISFDMKKIRFSRQKEIVCDICFLFSIFFFKIQVAVREETYEKRPCEKQIGLNNIDRVKLFSLSSLAYLSLFSWISVFSIFTHCRAQGSGEGVRLPPW